MYGLLNLHWIDPVSLPVARTVCSARDVRGKNIQDRRKRRTGHKRSMKLDPSSLPVALGMHAWFRSGYTAQAESNLFLKIIIVF